MVLRCTHNLCFEQKYEKYQSFFTTCISENFQFLEVKFSIYLNRHVFIMCFFFNQKILMFILFLNENICCGYTFEVPYRDTSKENHNVCFCGFYIFFLFFFFILWILFFFFIWIFLYGAMPNYADTNTGSSVCLQMKTKTSFFMTKSINKKITSFLVILLLYCRLWSDYKDKTS